MKENTVPNIWIAQEKVIHLYKVIVVGLGVFSAFAGTALVALNMRNPLVVAEHAGEVNFYPTERKRASLEKPEVERFAKHFLANLYVWNDFNGDAITRAIAPLSEDGLSAQIIGTQTQKYKELSGKKLAQSLAFVEVSVLEDRVVCRFDRILKIEGTPLVIPTEVTLSLAEGVPTDFNPMGIYVGGVKESENAK